MLTWDESRFSLGVADMDDAHREFIALVTLQTQADEAEFTFLFQKLMEHARMHFTEEGWLMRLCKFQALAEHESEHHRLLGELMQLKHSLSRGRTALVRAYVKNGLPEWFRLHLATMDAALAAQLKRMEITGMAADKQAAC